MTKELKPWTLRLSEELIAKIRKLAEQEKRSLNSQMIILLEKQLKKEQEK